MKNLRRLMFRSAAVLLLLVFAAGAAVLEAGVCLDAYTLCMLDPRNSATLVGSLYCANGFVFCVRYVDKK
ncbi:MAG: hypothetical protein PHF93_07490 [Acidobacteriota bacterium]|jgi:hypothetical protein|nr:hypothetical protein [Acidobacteriota bacterium]OQB58454.1 MAG: hypothetical protein BWX98_00666 [Candidatus Aminicenantes bacterium ADurb.Bin147]HNQ80310.1 hypothetical protein [Candidatus Aminicenantes bacterium]MDD8010812.1 hypothetical protein [Acidobacteriota bacterium]MDD8029042.1 hypothetical protein [Acidobacteriota bacterium]